MSASSSQAPATRNVLVTGAASGIGRCVAEAFAAEGARVVIADLAPESAQIAATLNAEHVHTDITDPSSVAAAVTTVEQRWGTIDVLVNNAGLTAGGGPILDLDVDSFDACVQVNVRGTFLMTRAVGAHMRDHQVRGAIVNLSSIGSRQPTPGLGHYEATKAAVDALTRSAAIELAGHGIRVNAVAPGPVETPMTAGLTQDDAAREAWEQRIPLGRIAAPPDIAPAVLFLASEQARHITGASLQVDGGQLLT